MSKQVRWQVPFAAHDGTRYRVDIYDEGYTGNPVVLTAGETPFVTDEDDSDDFFCPVRTQTGTLQVCTDIEGSNTPLKLEDILPANNIARPVRLLKYANGSYSVIEWQGFLGCEAYSQDYIGIPQILDLSLISVLEAWKSIDYSVNSEIKTFGELIGELLTISANRDGYFYTVHVPKDAFDIWETLINTSIYVEVEEYNNEESFIYKTKGKSLHDVLESVCKFLGWTAREHQQDIYLQLAQGYGTGYYDESEMVSMDMSDLVWMGKGHQRSIAAGAKTVKVTSKLEELDIDTGIPEIPYQDFQYESDKQIDAAHQVYMLPSTMDNAYSNLKFHHYAGEIYLGDDASTYVFNKTQDTIDVEDVIENSIAYAAGNSQAVVAYGTYQDQLKPLYAGAFLVRMQIDSPSSHDLQHQSTKDGLYLSLWPNAWKNHTSYTDPIFEMRSVEAFAAAEEGYLNLQAIFKTFWDMPACDAIGDPCRYMFELQVGNRYWDGSAWQTYRAKFFPEPHATDQTKFKNDWNNTMGIDQVDGLLIPTFFSGGRVMGVVTLRIFPETRMYNTIPVWRNMVQGVFFEQLDLSYIPKRSAKRTDRSENKYFRVLSTAFRDEISVDLDLSTWLHNNPSPYLLYKADGSEPLQYLTYYKPNGTTTEYRRPEVDLLNRLATYYGAARQRLELEVAHITTPLPMLRLNGINDGKVYLPLAESRDWRTGVCKLTCFECPS